MYDPAVDLDDVVRVETRIHATSSWNDPFYRVGLAAPQGRGSSEHSWTDGNVSAYMTDSGLWTACWESRKRMLWHFRSTATSSPPVTDPAHGIPHPCTAPVTMPFRRDNGEREYLTIRPSEDLLCLQFAEGSFISHRSGYHWGDVQNFPLFRWRRPNGRWEPPERVRHVAIELNMAWLDDGVMGGPIHGLLKADYVDGLAGFWFINYGLERRYRADGDRRGRRTFRAGGGVEFVEVLFGDDEWWDRSGRSDAVRSGGPAFSAAQDLARQLTFLKAKMAEMGDDGDDSSDDGAGERRLPLRYGVLACVKPGSAKHLLTKSEWIDALGPSNKPNVL
ncbi:hypothetical protein INS49_007862 [Diaporthe citri]|uniref:uncharacterized protein n=1 Tax=Diaporthe citri TaxID=83186 RepID=UPI001C823A5F|nr:uncharacterized protein INS49_007862 [Diaporthe citri]KAG6362768.1 hypothetical protein INS49_007862 [Diaporthe citri]